ncbi:hypothetical protein TRVA0_020S01354 [Trichomonascus vanleenenianus]|uniref:J domain-containing protein n=1 Tax=Trichomonascus vanleenenianus TaxID=2268995 RepID=UPI003ECB728F
MSDEEKEIEEFLKRESSEHGKDTEIERILNAFRLDAYSVLGLQPGCTKEDIKKTYRKKSLLIHPDKTANPQAPDAFDRLKKAESELQDDKKREVLDQAFTDARKLLIREKKWTIHDERLKSDEFLAEWREKTKQVLIEAELRRRKLAKIQMEEEGRQKRKQEEMEEEKRQKVESKKQWDATRDSRVKNWRDYQKTEEKKRKKRKKNVLG